MRYATAQTTSKCCAQRAATPQQWWVAVACTPARLGGRTRLQAKHAAPATVDYDSWDHNHNRLGHAATAGDEVDAPASRASAAVLEGKGAGVPASTTNSTKAGLAGSKDKQAVVSTQNANGTHPNIIDMVRSTRTMRGKARPAQIGSAASRPFTAALHSSSPSGQRPPNYNPHMLPSYRVTTSSQVPRAPWDSLPTMPAVSHSSQNKQATAAFEHAEHAPPITRLSTAHPAQRQQPTASGTSQRAAAPSTETPSHTRPQTFQILATTTEEIGVTASSETVGPSQPTTTLPTYAVSAIAQNPSGPSVRVKYIRAAPLAAPTVPTKSYRERQRERIAKELQVQHQQVQVEQEPSAGGQSAAGLGVQPKLEPQEAPKQAAAAPQGRVVQRPDGTFTLQGYEEEMQAMQNRLQELQTRLHAAVTAEMKAEAKALSALRSLPLKRLQRDGVVLAELTIKPAGELFRQPVWHLAPHTGYELPYHRFRQGDTVLLSRMISDSRTPTGSSPRSSDASKTAISWPATVLEVSKQAVKLTLDSKESAALQALEKLAAKSGVRFRLDQALPDITSQRQLDAIKRLGKMRNNAAATERLLRTILVGTPNSPHSAQQPPTWCSQAWRQEAAEVLRAQSNLNNSQRYAVSLALRRTLTLWQGPPGTGKTRTLLAYMEVVIRASSKTQDRWDKVGTLLACADTNAAVDNLVEGLHERGMRVVRVGAPAKVRPSCRALTLEGQAEQTARGKQAMQKRARALAVLAMYKRLRDGGRVLGEVQHAEEEEARALVREAESELRLAAEEVLQQAQVVCATCSGAADSLLSNRTFRVVVVDEASQATEPSLLIPLTQGAQSVVIAGDPKQLPPTIVSKEAFVHKLDTTLFERLMELGIEPSLLDTQYRMHPAISAFPSMAFYDGRLRDGVRAVDKPAPQGFPWPQPGVPLALVAIDDGQEESGKKASGGAEAASADGASFLNRTEAHAALQAAYALWKGGDVSSIALLSPYRGQVRLLEALLRRAGSLLEGAPIVISSVDGYQGREADVVVFTTVRCNARGSIGFVADERRLNVGITRPRRGLVLVGSPRTLAQSSLVWRSFIDGLQERGVMMQRAQLPPLGEWLPLDAALDSGTDSEADAVGMDVLQQLQDRAL